MSVRPGNLPHDLGGDASKSAAPKVFAASEDRVLHRGVLLTSDVAEGLLRLFRKEAADPGDYFRNNARALAVELEAAMRDAGYITEEIAA